MKPAPPVSRMRSYRPAIPLSPGQRDCGRHLTPDCTGKIRVAEKGRGKMMCGCEELPGSVALTRRSCRLARLVLFVLLRVERLVRALEHLLGSAVGIETGHAGGESHRNISPTIIHFQVREALEQSGDLLRGTFGED